MKREVFSTGTPWESKYGYSRAVRAGQHVFVTGTTSTDERGNVLGVGDVYTQTVQILRRIETVLARAGADIKDVVSVRAYMTDIDDIDEIGRAHKEFFNQVRPTMTAIQVSALASPDMLVEIEAQAIIDA